MTDVLVLGGSNDPFYTHCGEKCKNISMCYNTKPRYLVREMVTSLSPATSTGALLPDNPDKWIP